MRNKRRSLFIGLALLAGVRLTAGLPATNSPAAIPWDEIGSKAGADLKGDGLAVTPSECGARLHCVFQRLDGEATSEGLWLSSTVTHTASDRFRVTAMEVGRKAAHVTVNSHYLETSIALAGAGEVSVCGQTARFSRPGLREEYSVSMDGVRQDFIVEDSPGRARLQPSVPSSETAGELVVKLAVDGAHVESGIASGLVLTLANSGRKIAYSRLRVTDATGKELPARIEVASAGDEAASLDFWLADDKDIEGPGLFTPAPGRAQLAVVVNDAGAVYPVRIDPTFSDANWVGMGGVSGTDGEVLAAVTDGSGDLYIGGGFTLVGSTIAKNIALWNGTNWSALGSGMSGVGSDGNGPYVSALAVSGGTVYAGGDFTMAGGDTNASYAAQWNGSSWSALGSGLNGEVSALAVLGANLYAGGTFTRAHPHTAPV